MYCMADSDCRATLTCINECQLYQPRSKQAMCAYICEMTDGKIWKNNIGKNSFAGKKWIYAQMFNTNVLLTRSNNCTTKNPELVKNVLTNK